jgi:hypothetical protein
MFEPTGKTNGVTEDEKRFLKIIFHPQTPIF